MLRLCTGEFFDVCVDARKESRTFGHWYGVELSDTGVSQIYMSQGFAHGFCVLSDWVDLHYKVSHPYNPSDEGGGCFGMIQILILNGHYQKVN